MQSLPKLIPVTGRSAFAIADAVVAGPVAQLVTGLVTITVTGLVTVAVGGAIRAGAIAPLETVARLIHVLIAELRDIRLPEPGLVLIHDPLGNPLGRLLWCFVTVTTQGSCRRGHDHRRYRTQRHHLPPLSHDSSFSRPAPMETPRTAGIRRASDKKRALPTDGARLPHAFLAESRNG
jgi:hypothetical protein